MRDLLPIPLQFKGVMVSSTFSDLRDHRAALIGAIKGQGLTDIAMENDSAKPDVDVIDSSLQMVGDSSAYIGVISHKYGQIPECSKRNPDQLSLSELEFNEAQRLNRPILLFIMGEKHLVMKADVEIDPSKIRKLEAFKERAKKKTPNSSVHRVYATFESLEEFTRLAIHAVAHLRRYLDKQTASGIPAPPALYAEPPYIGSHAFIGRRIELERLSVWASPVDQHPVILFQAIGGTGKSSLIWEWTTKHALNARSDWEGRFWYSFYERGATMADFCRHALAYITRQSLDDVQKKETFKIREQLLRHLQARPWLFILDGLERVFVAYHRFDAAQLVDEQAGTRDQIAHRDPCAAIRPEDDDLLRALAGAAPSKLVLTSRLVPRVLLNSSSQPIPGVLRVTLPGLQPPDAEALLRYCGVTGNSQKIQHYVKTHCDGHPLVTGILAGLVNDYLPARGDFDAWADDPNHGGQLNLATLDLVQKRNHILHSAFEVLPEKSRQLLSTLALVSEAVDYQTLSQLNPHLPPEPKEVKELRRPEEEDWWDDLPDHAKDRARKEYEASRRRRKEYEQAFTTWLHSEEYINGPQELVKTVHDLETRGLLQYDAQARHYDLHPVVRGIAAGGLLPNEKEKYGQLVVDYFSRQMPSYEHTAKIEDVRNRMQVVRTLLQMGHYQRASDAYTPELATALSINFEAEAEKLSLLRPFFHKGWNVMPDDITAYDSSNLASSAAKALQAIGEREEAMALLGAVLLNGLRRGQRWESIVEHLISLSGVCWDLHLLAKQERCCLLALNIANLATHSYSLFSARSAHFEFLTRIGRLRDAELSWPALNAMSRNWPRELYIQGKVEYQYALLRFYCGDLNEEHLLAAEQLAKSANAHRLIRYLYALRGEWDLNHGRWLAAANSFAEAIRMAREVGQDDPVVTARLMLARVHLNELPNAREQAEQIAAARNRSYLSLAELWLAIGDSVQAEKNAVAAYKEAWADGEPYVWRYRLDRAADVLNKLGIDVPKLAPYDVTKEERFPWDDELVTAIKRAQLGKEVNKAIQVNEADFS